MAPTGPVNDLVRSTTERTGANIMEVGWEAGEVVGGLGGDEAIIEVTARHDDGGMHRSELQGNRISE